VRGGSVALTESAGTADADDRRFAVALAAVVGAASVFRVACWVGPGARDDAQYMAYALDVWRGSFAFLSADSVFAARPAVYAPVALAGRAFPSAWPDSASAYFLVMSLVQITAVGLIGAQVARRVGLIAAALMAVFPLDVVFASQVMPDLPMAAWITVGVCLLRRAESAGLTVAAGVAFGLAAATKEFAVVAMAIVPPLLPWTKGGVAVMRRTGWLVLGLALPLAVEMAWFSVHATPLDVMAAIVHNARAEKNGNPDVLYLYRMLFETLPAAPGARWFGGLAWAWLASVIALAGVGLQAGSRCVPWRQAAFFAWWAAAFFLFLQDVGPWLAGRTTVERMERFLLPLGAPLALGVAVVIGTVLRGGSPVRRAGAWIATGVLLVSMVHASVVYAFAHEVILASDWRDISRALREAGIRSALMDRDAAFRVSVFSGEAVIGRAYPEDQPLLAVPSSEWFVVSANSTDHGRRAGEPVPAAWRLAFRVPGPLVGPLVDFDPVVYWTGPSDLPPLPRHNDVVGQPWTLAAVVDVGNIESERAHAYAIEQPSWHGRRRMVFATGVHWYAPTGLVIDDDGRAFLGAQSFEVHGIVPNVAMRIVKRADGNVAHQLSRVVVDGWEAGMFRTGASVGRWVETAIDVPAERVTRTTIRVSEEFVSSSSDVNVFDVRVYQARGR
jgi:4-amino-4-deoxy-L-arabinose transferase-like glycosyltransferase